jgi:hypothetical protein
MKYPWLCRGIFIFTPQKRGEGKPSILSKFSQIAIGNCYEKRGKSLSIFFLSKRGERIEKRVSVCYP